jgi:hypothetical protein
VLEKEKTTTAEQQKTNISTTEQKSSEKRDSKKETKLFNAGDLAKFRQKLHMYPKKS